jgi:alpha-N-arabinofuranosidase
VFRSRRVDGPYEPWSGNPILTQRGLPAHVPGAVTSTGHADLVEGPDGKWWTIFLGVRPYQGRYSPMGRETFLLPVEWTADGWPTILPAGQRVPLVAPAPAGHRLDPALATAARWSVDFRQPALDLSWIMLRSPARQWWQVDAARGALLLLPQADSLNDTTNPAFLAKRVQHAAFTATARLEVPAEAGVAAGLALFQNETHHYFLAVHRGADGLRVVLEQANGGKAFPLAQAPLAAAGTVALRAIVDHDKCSFEYSPGDGAWRRLVSNADAKLLTTEAAGGFVGATVGLHARLDR